MAWQQVMKNQNWVVREYIDAFAGTGYCEAKTYKNREDWLLKKMLGEETERLLEGSARIALSIGGFEKYTFIETDPDRMAALKEIQKDFPKANIEFVNEDANSFVKRKCASTNWKKHRAVLFLDPYGLDVEWSTLEAVANTQAIDVFILVALGQEINRHLQRNGEVTPAGAARLDKFFGSPEWRDRFLAPKKQMSLFDTGKQEMEKIADFDVIADYCVERLKTIFPGVAQNPLFLRNQTNNPLYMLAFAAANARGAKPALKIAHHILAE